MVTSPYIAGNPVGGSPAFVGRGKILNAVLRMLRHPSENAIVLYGQRRIGKTSVLQELAVRLPNAGPFKPILFNLEDKAAAPLGRVILELAQTISYELGLPELKSSIEEAPEEFTSTFLPHALHNLADKQSLVLLFDEFDVLDSPEKGQAVHDFFPYLASLMKVSERLQFAFVIGRRPDELSNLTMAVFKGVRSERISLLGKQETAELVRLSEVNGSLKWTHRSIDFIYSLTGGHPFLTQRLCQEIWDTAYDNGAADKPIGEPDVLAAVRPALQASTNALEWLWTGLGPAERIVASALAEAGARTINHDELEKRLEDSGVKVLVGELRSAPAMLKQWDLLEPEEQGYRFRVELLRQWIEKQKPLSRVQGEIDRIEPAAENLFQAASLLYKDGNLTDSIGLLRQAVRLNPNHQQGTLLLAEILMADDQLDESLGLLEKLHSQNPPLALGRLTQVLLLKASLVNAEAERLSLLEQILGYDKTNSDARTGIRSIWEHRGDKALANDDLAEAISAFKLAGHDRKYRNTALRLIRFREDREEYDEAVKIAEELESIVGGDSDELPDILLLYKKRDLASLYEIAKVAISDGASDEAISLLIEMINIEPRFRDVARLLSQTVEASRKTQGSDHEQTQGSVHDSSRVRRDLSRPLFSEPSVPSGPTDQVTARVPIDDHPHLSEPQLDSEESDSEPLPGEEQAFVSSGRRITDEEIQNALESISRVYPGILGSQANEDRKARSEPEHTNSDTLYHRKINIQIIASLSIAVWLPVIGILVAIETGFLSNNASESQLSVLVPLYGAVVGLQILGLSWLRLAEIEKNAGRSLASGLLPLSAIVVSGFVAATIQLPGLQISTATVVGTVLILSAYGFVASLARQRLGTLGSLTALAIMFGIALGFGEGSYGWLATAIFMGVPLLGVSLIWLMNSETRAFGIVSIPAGLGVVFLFHYLINRSFPLASEYTSRMSAISSAVSGLVLLVSFLIAVGAFVSFSTRLDRNTKD